METTTANDVLAAIAASNEEQQIPASLRELTTLELALVGGGAGLASFV